MFPRRQCVSLRGNGCMPTSLPRFVYLGYFACLLCLFALIACSVVLHEETEGANMSNRRYRRRSKMKRRGVKNASQNGSKMATWRPLGSPWAPTLLPDAPRSRPGEALARPGALQKFFLAAWERPGSEKWIDFTLPGGSWRGSGRSFWELFSGWAGGNEKKQEKSLNNSIFWSCFCMRFLTISVCVLFASTLAGAKA